jgi:hypothetical protein
VEDAGQAADDIVTGQADTNVFENAALPQKPRARHLSLHTDMATSPDKVPSVAPRSRSINNFDTWNSRRFTDSVAIQELRDLS